MVYLIGNVDRSIWPQCDTTWLVKFSGRSTELAKFSDPFAGWIVNGNFVLHHVRNVEQAIFVQGQTARHRVGLEGFQKPPLLIESLHTRSGFRVRLSKVGDQDLVFLVHRDRNRYVKLSVAMTVFSPGQHNSGSWRGFIPAPILSPEWPRHERRDPTAADADEIPASH